MGGREALLEEMSRRVRLVTEEPSVTWILDADALRQADLLAGSLDEAAGTDLPARYVLGWFYWYRFRALPHEPDGGARDRVLEMLTPCFLAGMADLPEALLPHLAYRATLTALAALVQESPAEDPQAGSVSFGQWSRILQSIPDDHPYRAIALVRFGAALKGRFDRTGVLDELDQAVDVTRQAVDVSRRAEHTAPPDEPVQAMALSNLVGMLMARFERARRTRDSVERSGAKDYLDEAIDVGRQAVNASPTHHFIRLLALSNLGPALRTRFEWTGATDDLDEAVDCARQVMNVNPTPDLDWAGRLSNLGVTLRARFVRTGVLSDLAEAVDAGRRAVDATPDGHPDQARRLSNLGITLRARFARTGVLSDLNETMTIMRRAVAATPADHLDQALYLGNLGSALLTRFARTAVLGDLDEAVDVCRRAAAIAPLDDPSQVVLFRNLGTALLTRFRRIGALGDLDESIAAALQTWVATGIGQPEGVEALSLLAATFRDRFELFGTLTDLDAAVACQRDAVNEAPANHPGQAGLLSGLCTALHVRFQRTGVLDDLHEAVDAGRRAVDATPVDHPYRAGRLSGLGNVLGDLFEQTGMPGDLDEAVAVGRQAVDATPADHPDRASWLYNLGLTLRTRFEHTAVAADLDDALGAFAEAARVDSAKPSVRIDAARNAAFYAERKNDLAGAADWWETAVRLLPEVAPRRLRRADRQVWVSRIGGLANHAAATVLADTTTPAPRRAERALALLETGRAVLLSQSLETRSDLADLRQAHPDLAARFAELRDHLDQDTRDTVHTDPVAGRRKIPSELFTALSDAAGQSGAVDQQDAADRIALAEELATTLRSIRTLDGFATFGLPPTGQELTAEAADGPVVTFNIASKRCDALILTSDRIMSLELPGLTEQALIDQVTAFHQALPAAASLDFATHVVNREIEAVSTGSSARDTLNSVLAWLWDNAAGPVLDTLGFHGTPSGDITEWPRLWWAPGGRLGLLPLHAAGHHTDPDTPQRRTVMDRVVSSYTPTIRALRHARRSGVANHPPNRSLIVAMPTTPGLPGNGHLPHVRAEAEILSTLLPHPLTLIEPDPDGTTPDDTKAVATDLPTARRVLDELPSHAIVHFACHGTHDPTEPAASRLLLHDHAEAPLTVAHLDPVDLDRAQLAYLSACDTALSTAGGFLDEAIHLASAFQLAGFPHVIGTLWAVDDKVAVEVASHFYRALRDPRTGHLDVGRAAYALHQTVRSLRDKLPGSPSLWAAYLHSGA
ncbi:CHAT domain-containing protein [Actinocrispum wychmicini]|uniref:Tetratricopeptide repeat protein n=1 Tax=Actinocrispum wychmicini TaxID=1213861 RepID=A0A4R2IWC6_9PSEU|nr:CHAT domain-containing protein [Actinocrispum wychmicini]TCO49794.1 tetratricopeptide repeat protein [Actinocrispum wychmicini]